MSDHGYTCWGQEWSEYIDGIADHPRESFEAEDFEQRHFDFVFAPLRPCQRAADPDANANGGGLKLQGFSPPSSHFAAVLTRGDAGALSPPLGGAGTLLSGRTEAKRTESPQAQAGLNGGQGDHPHGALAVDSYRSAA